MRTIDIEATQQAIRARREELGLSQQDVADALGISQQGVHDYETRLRAGVQARTLIQIADILECDCCDLVTLTEETK